MRAEDILGEGQTNARLGGMEVRKGTVAAFVANAKLWSDPDTSVDDRAAAEKDIKDNVEQLRAVGLFDVFELKDQSLRKMMLGA